MIRYAFTVQWNEMHRPFYSFYKTTGLKLNKIHYQNHQYQLIFENKNKLLEERTLFIENLTNCRSLAAVYLHVHDAIICAICQRTVPTNWHIPNVEYRTKKLNETTRSICDDCMRKYNINEIHELIHASDIYQGLNDIFFEQVFIKSIAFEITHLTINNLISERIKEQVAFGGYDIHETREEAKRWVEWGGRCCEVMGKSLSAFLNRGQTQSDVCLRRVSELRSYYLIG